MTLSAAIAAFGSEAKSKLSNVAAAGEPVDQLRAPLERLIGDLAELVGLPRTAVSVVGESSLADLKTRPDYAVTVHNALVGFIEVKAPGKGPIRVGSGTVTTSSNGISSGRFRTSFTPMATSSASGAAANWRGR